MNQNILFVCSANKQRSKTAEDYCSLTFKDFNFKSAGTNIKLCNKEGTNPVDTEMLEWANLILVMETKHKELIIKNTQSKYIKKIIVLDIQDIYK
ncbi:hypothetical protein FLGE108171_15020 [Flavobacterium gelidilacus]|uniref:hypothetical protein n=1 Tax=Flavobacterium gelidilacus TaxID=206041 RepID=UPI000403C85F|nr:hypothetical protein [Flavobacterium gelidilacus]